MNELKFIEIDGKKMSYQLTYKKIKKVYLRIEEGQILINAPYHCSISFIENMIKEHWDSILNKIDQYQPMYDYQDGGYVIVFKQRYPIHLVDLNYKKAVFKENEIIVYDKHIEQVLDKELKKYLLELIYKYVEFYVSKDQRLPFPKITLKKTKRRYGACFYREGRISFNPILIHSSKAFIEYVVVHELCHFIEPNHSPAFYHEIEQKLPNYKTILKEEKEHDYIDE
ncbi:MAG: DUF45 domain-containing protein [Erysipelotrichaceae bacterium]|nr:DUF45 domain-containing protein [Erysipelotrichaceae bacterium]